MIWYIMHIINKSTSYIIALIYFIYYINYITNFEAFHEIYFTGLPDRYKEK